MVTVAYIGNLRPRIGGIYSITISVKLTSCFGASQGLGYLIINYLFFLLKKLFFQYFSIEISHFFNESFMIITIIFVETYAWTIAQIK